MTDLDHSLSAYMPADRRAALAAGLRLPARSRGAVLMADISGFTPLTEAMIETHGRERGSEEMASLLNGLFDTMARPVHDYLGSVISISGDALTCWFAEHVEGDVPAHRGAVLRALACAWSLQEAMSASSVASTTTRSIAVKVSIASGVVRRALVGNPDVQQVEVIAGAPLERMALGDLLANPGEILLAEEALDAVADCVEVLETRVGDAGCTFAVVGRMHDRLSPTPWPVLSAEKVRGLEGLARPWLLPAVYDQIVVGQSDFVAEIRAISALFVRFGGIDYAVDERAEEKLDSVIRWAQRVFERHDGSLLHVTIGEKGSYLNGTFGAPVAEDDHPVAAVAAAVELVGSLPEELAFVADVAAGLARGVMFAGAIGSPVRRVYGTSGSAANRAARLMQAAPVGVAWCDEATVAAADGRWEFSPPERVRVKGMSEPIAVVRPLQPRERKLRADAEPRAAAFYGRERESARFAQALTNLEGGRGGLVVVEGEPGIGKTALLDAMQAQADAVGLRTLRCGAEHIERGVPYRAVRSVFEALLGAELELPPELAPLMPLLSGVVRRDWEQTPLIREMTPEVRSENTLRLLVGILAAAAAPSPFVVVLDDAQWADATSLGVIARAHREIAGVLFVIAMRPVLAESLSDEMRGIRDAADLHLPLEPLDSADIAALAASVVDEASISERWTERVTEMAGGNPFFAQELARALLDAGAAWTDVELPMTVQGVVTSRVDHLPPVPQLVLKIASVIGGAFEIDLLRRAHPGDIGVEPLDAALQVLVKEGFVAVRDRGPKQQYAIVHAITRDVTYAQLTFAQRRAVHTSVAQWYETAAEGPIEQHFATLAHHWERGEVITKAVLYLESAGDLALNSSAYPEAADFFDRLIALGGDAGADAGRWRLKLGRTYRGWGRFHESRVWLESALPYYGEPLPKTQAGVVFQTLRQLCVQAVHLNAADRIAAEPGDTSAVEVAQLHGTLGELAFFAGRQLLSLYATVRAVNVLEATARTEELATVYGAIGLYAGLMRLRRLNRHYHAQALAIADQLRRPALRADVLRLNCLYQVCVGNWPTARADAAQALDIHARLGDTRGHGDCLNMLAHIACFTGDFAETQHHSDALRDVARRSENPMHEIWALAWEGKALLRLGAYAEAERALEAVLIATRAEPDIHDEFCARANLALVQLHRGCFQDAVHTADSTLAWRAALDVEPSAYPILDAYGALADVYLGTLESTGLTDAKLRDTARAGALSTYRLLRRFARLFPIAKPALLLHRGRLEWLRGRTRRAKRSWRSAVLAGNRLAMRYDSARAQLALAQRSAADDPERARRLDCAMDSFEALGTPLELSLARELGLR